MKCDLHCHTSYSNDSISSPKKMIDAAIKKGIDCLAISDHNTIDGVKEAEEYAKGKAILIIPAIEIKSKAGDILGLNIRKSIPKRLTALETIREIKKARGMAIIPHPFGILKHKFKENLEGLVKEIDGIEVLNSTMYGSANKEAFDFAEKHELAFTAGSDAHFSNMVGKVYLEIPGKNLSVEEILRKIKNKEGKLGGKAGSFLEKFLEHLKRYYPKILKKIIKK